MKVYDVWVEDLGRHEARDSGWSTVYAYTVDEMQDYMEERFPDSDWIIIENELPF